MKENGNYVDCRVTDIIFENECGVFKMDTIGKIIREKTDGSETILVRNGLANEELEKILNNGHFDITLITHKFNCRMEFIGEIRETIENMRLVKKFTTRTSKPSDTDVCYVFVGNDNYNYKDIDRIIQRDNNEQLIRVIRDIRVNIDTYNIVKSIDGLCKMVESTSKSLSAIANNLKDIDKKLNK